MLIWNQPLYHWSYWPVLRSKSLFRAALERFGAPRPPRDTIRFAGNLPGILRRGRIPSVGSYSRLPRLWKPVPAAPAPSSLADRAAVAECADVDARQLLLTEVVKVALLDEADRAADSAFRLDSSSPRSGKG
jgi:hypothetical protein